MGEFTRLVYLLEKIESSQVGYRVGKFKNNVESSKIEFEFSEWKVEMNRESEDKSRVESSQIEGKRVFWASTQIN